MSRPSEPQSLSATRYPRVRRKLAFIGMQLRARRLLDAIRLGSGIAARLCCVLLIGVFFFFVSLVVSFGLGDAPGYAILQASAVFVIAMIPWLILILGSGDESLEHRQEELLADLPQAELAWEEHRAERVKAREAEETEKQAALQQSALRAVAKAQEASKHPEMTRCPYCRETIVSGARKCKHCGEMLDPSLRRSRGDDSRVAVYVKREGASRRASPGVAAVLEIVFGLFLQTFGIGHIYAAMSVLGCSSCSSTGRFLPLTVCLFSFAASVS